MKRVVVAFIACLGCESVVATGDGSTGEGGTTSSDATSSSPGGSGPATTSLPGTTDASTTDGTDASTTDGTNASTTDGTNEGTTYEPTTTTGETAADVTSSTGTGPESSSTASSGSTTAESSSGASECTLLDECVVDDDCPLTGAVCIACSCIGGVEECASYGEGELANCVTDGIEACMNDAAECVFDDIVDPQLGVCSMPCTDVCECPAPPAGFEGQLACNNLVDPRETHCYLSCEAGQDCPMGWTCVADFICMPGEIATFDPYGDCANLPGECPAGPGGQTAFCLLVPDAEAGAPGEGAVCATLGCDDADDCLAAPLTGTAVLDCTDVTGDTFADCWLDCAGGATCPDGMVCHPDYGVCYWESV